MKARVGYTHGFQLASWVWWLVLACWVGLSFSGCKKDSVGTDTDFFIKYYGGPELNGGKDVVQTADGGYLLLGERATGTSAQTQVIAVKVDTAGNAVNTTVLGEGRAHQLFALTNGNYMAIGEVEDGGGTTDMLFVQLDPTGAVAWRMEYGNPGRDETAVSCIERRDGGLTILGNEADGTGHWDLRVVFATAAGDTELTYHYGQPNTDEWAKATIEVRDNNFLVCGTTNANSMGVDLFALSVLNPPQAIDQVWDWPLVGDQYCVGVARLSTGNYLVLGGESSSNVHLVGALWDPVSLDSVRNVQDYDMLAVEDFLPEALRVTGTGIYVAGHTSGDDFAIAMLDSAGILTGQQSYPGLDQEQAYGVTATADTGWALVGTLSRSGAGLMMLVKDNGATNE